ncbi:hypothetical protein ACHMW6_06485 [Pseudoduganella sp. UC29_106]|uniref:GTA baseplate fiber-binding domain-containing protein n=1 Tax=Pseudoduganella sp. UC29_106 TaxID=3374553 RepID=UPI0037580F54
MSWAGAQVFKSADGSTYDGVLSSSSASIIGQASTVLGDFAGGNVFDHTNSVTIALLMPGELSSYTKPQVLNGAGAIALSVPGGWEIVQYMTATLLSPGVYQLSGLLRGRRGTEWAIGRHAAGDTFVLLTTTALRRMNFGTSEIGLARSYKGVTFRAKLSDATAQSFTNRAVGLKPYAPVHLTGSRDGSNNLTISWTRRTRIGGEWRDFVDVPIGEESLQFVAEIWNDDFTTLLRTISSITTTSTTYSAADQTTDGLTPGDPVSVRIYQISAVVGRGSVLEGQA